MNIKQNASISEPLLSQGCQFYGGIDPLFYPRSPTRWASPVDSSQTIDPGHQEDE